MKEVLSYSEIEEQNISECVLIENPELTENLEIKRGKVLHRRMRPLLFYEVEF